MTLRVKLNEDMRGHVDAVRREGYTFIRQGVDPAHLGRLQEAFAHALDAPDGIGKAGFGGQREATGVLERYPAAIELAEHPTLLSVVASLIGRDTTLCQPPLFLRKPAGAESHIGWHNDFKWMVDTPYPRQNAWIQVNVLVNDVAEDQGPMMVMPGTHLSEGPCPDGLPIEDPRAVPFTGRAGDVMINNMEIWHCNGHNTSDRPREMIILGYKHAWMRPYNDLMPAEPSFAEQLESPLQRQLCQLGNWSGPQANSNWAIEVEGASLW